MTIVYNFNAGGMLVLKAFDVTIADLADSEVVTHGLVGTPVLERFVINAAADVRGYHPRITTITATQFTLDLDGDIADGALTFKVTYMGTC